MKQKPPTAADFISSCEVQTLKLPSPSATLSDHHLPGQNTNVLAAQIQALTDPEVNFLPGSCSMASLSLKFDAKECVMSSKEAITSTEVNLNFTLMPASASWPELQPTNLHFYSCLFIICIWFFFCATSSSICFLKHIVLKHRF